MEAMESVVDHLEVILEQIHQLNLTSEKSFLKSDCQANEKIVEYIPKLTPHLLDLLKALTWKLECTTKILLSTSQLLNKLDGKEGSSLANWLLQLHKQILHAAGHFVESEKELLEMNCRKMDSIQQAQCVSGKSDEEKGKGTQLLDCVNQPFQKSSSMHEEENRAHEIENKVVVIETVVSLHQKTARKELGFPVLLNKENQSIPDKLVTAPSKDNGNGVHSVKSSGTKSSENIALEDLPESNESNVIVSRQLENSNLSNLQIPPNQEKQAEIKECLEERANENHGLVEKPRNRKGSVNQKDKNNEIAQRNQECFKSSDLPKNIHLSTGDLEEEVDERDWMNKEFLIGVNGPNEPEVACCITAPRSILESIVVKFVNDLSSLVVDDAEELVSNVINAECSQAGPPIVSPITVAIPFISRYRGMYRDIMVKVTNSDFQSCYLTPVSLEGHQGNHKATFAEVKTCQLGIFSVVSCLKMETITIPRKGVSRKISMDPRMSFFYPPLTFSSRVTMHLKVQSIEPSTISLLKTKHEEYHSVVSTSPLVHLQHPSSHPFNKSITVILPCPPNQEKKMEGDETDHVRATSASAHRVTTVHPFRAKSASPRKHGENLNESLKLLAYRNKEEGWAIMDDIPVRNARNGLVSFELNEPLDSFIVIRLSSSMNNMHLGQFIQKLEEAIYNTMVKVVLYRKREDPYQIVVLLVPVKELNLELQSLHRDGYSGPPEPSQQFKMREGEQVYFRFSGNIFASDDGVAFGKMYKLTFHVQRKPRLALHIKEVDEFGNYSSPYYKGTALFYKVSKEMIAKNLEQPLQLDSQEQELLCKLTLTLPKKERLIKRPQSTKRISTDLSEALWDNLLYWLSQELSEDNASYLALSLPLHRSTLQLIKLKCPDNLSAQIYELLCFWKRNLPRSADKIQLLSRYLCKTGRSDLAEDLQFKWENKVFTRRIP